MKNKWLYLGIVSSLVFSGLAVWAFLQAGAHEGEAAAGLAACRAKDSGRCEEDVPLAEMARALWNLGTVLLALAVLVPLVLLWMGIVQDHENREWAPAPGRKARRPPGEGIALPAQWARAAGNPAHPMPAAVGLGGSARAEPTAEPEDWRAATGVPGPAPQPAAWEMDEGRGADPVDSPSVR